MNPDGEDGACGRDEARPSQSGGGPGIVRAEGSGVCGRDEARPSRGGGGPGIVRAEGGDVCGRGEARPSQTLPVRHRPSRNSVLVGQNNRTIILFVSVNANKRQKVFANPAAVQCIVSAWKEAHGWLVGRYVVMPDHVHFCCAPCSWPIPDFHKWMKFWKAKVALSFPTEHARPLWQRQCWDTQLRQGESFSAKCEYMVNNPVRKGLVATAEDWPYQGELNVFQWHDR